MTLLTRALSALPRDRDGRVSVEQGLIAALIGVVVVSIVTTLSGTLEAPSAHPAPTSVGEQAP